LRRRLESAFKEVDPFGELLNVEAEDVHGGLAGVELDGVVLKVRVSVLVDGVGAGSEE
jgi:hypothetical protein